MVALLLMLHHEPLRIFNPALDADSNLVRAGFGSTEQSDGLETGPLGIFVRAMEIDL